MKPEKKTSLKQIKSDKHLIPIPPKQLGKIKGGEIIVTIDDIL